MKKDFADRSNITSSKSLVELLYGIVNLTDFLQWCEKREPAEKDHMSLYHTLISYQLASLYL